MAIRKRRRIANRLAKKGVTFLRWEQNDPHLVTMRAIVETRCQQRFAKACVFPRDWLGHVGGRVIADAILAQISTPKQMVA